ncbi:MAG: 23S rRNA (adenine(2503)-C(2))-methyltransferase RlmN [Propionibacteriaceae bacterium]|jgi:23S rRNA (adenine2503-C2)-methyltransferase|nr:23S rRNA (adenine(2503)-C(2))-methyltransferase RlmN [Propionibacteriaceae bacterium]
MTHWLELDPAAQAGQIAALGFPRFRVGQLNRHLLTHHSFDPDTWTDVPKAERAALAELAPNPLTVVRAPSADDGQTIKTLWRLADGELVESVLMAYPGRSTVCVSSQVGCGMGCPFCATGQLGLRRNLTAAEIAAQVIAAAREPAFPRLSNVVFMGMGEPLANYGPVLASIRLIAGPMGISARGITVSTVGLVPRIDQLAKEGLPLTLALSLHAPDDELRDQLCPLNRRFPVAEVLAAGRRYFDATGRRVSVEYALIDSVNDQTWRAERLGRALGRRWAHVNLIGLNPTPGVKWKASGRQAEFVKCLAATGISVTIRDTRGQDIAGACGQLAAAD